MREHAGKVVVTGGAGFIGSHLVDRLLTDKTAQVVVLDNLHRGKLINLEQHGENPRLRFVNGDIRDADVVADVCREARVVYHLAAQSSVMGGVEDTHYSFSTNVVGTFNVLRAASQAGVERLVFSSSREVYGEPIDLPVDEAQPLLAINLYGATKVTGEALSRAFRRTYGLHSVILRFANVYGPRDFGRVIPLWIDQASAGEDLKVYGGKQLIDFVWIDQVVEALIRAASADTSAPPMNIGSGTGTPIVQLAKRIAWLSGGRSHVKLLPARSVEVTRFVANIDRMRRLLGIEPPIDPLHMLRTMMAPLDNDAVVDSEAPLKPLG